MIGFADFEAFLKASFPDMTDGMVERFRLMDAGYRDWNAKINVISRKDIDSLYDHHVLHSLAIAEYLRTQRPEVYSMFTAPHPKGSVASASQKGSYSTVIDPITSPDNAAQAGLRVLDLGTGGGFPGIPLAVMFPNVRFTLCDSVGKKTIVAREIANMPGLDNRQRPRGKSSWPFRLRGLPCRGLPDRLLSLGEREIFPVHPLPQRRRHQRGDLRPDVP